MEFKQYIKHVLAEGEEFNFFIANKVGKDWYDTSRPDPRAEIRYIRDQMIRKGSFILECGCHHGYTTILLSKWVGSQGRIIAFDANPLNVTIAKNNIDLNNIKNVEIFNSIVGNQNGYLYATKKSNAKVVPFLQNDNMEIAAIRLDDFLSGQTPDVIKIDVEGYELEVLKGAQITLDRKKTNLAIEIHGDTIVQYGSTVDELFNFIGLEDYMCWLGIGAQANDDIQPYIVGATQIPYFSRFYLFALPKR